MTDRQKRRRITTLMSSTRHWELEDEALKLAYSIVDPKIRARCLEDIADAMAEPEIDDEL